MNKPIYLCGPLAPPGQAPNGGYAAANARTIATLETMGQDVVAMPYPQPTGRGLVKLTGYVAGFRRLLLQLAQQPPGVLHITGLYKQFILPELLLLHKARGLGYATVYDIRAGSMLRYYQNLGPVYRRLFDAALRIADRVMIEGLEYGDFVRQRTEREPFYFPNHIDTSHVAPRRTNDVAAGPVLIYAGRVTREKGIETLMAAAALLVRDGQPCSVMIVGPAEPELQATLQARYGAVSAQWLGSRSSADVLQLCAGAHFFVFPTRHSGEGHSNALTEAMSKGCVPIASRNGFNASVIDDAGVVLPLEAEPEAYAAAVLALWSSGLWQEYSARARSRAQQCFDSRKAVGRLLSEYQELMRV